MTGPQATVAPLPATPTAMTATPGLDESAIHGAEKAVETMKIYEGAMGNIQLVMNVVDPVVGVCTPSLLLSVNGTTLAI